MPSFLTVLALGAAYVSYGGLTWMQSVFYGVGAAVIGIIAMSAHKLTIKNIGTDKLLWAVYVVAAAVTIVTDSEVAWIFVAAGVLTWLVRAPPHFVKGGPLAAAFAAQLPSVASVATAIDWPVLVQIADGQPGNHMAVARVVYEHNGRFASADEKTATRFVERHWEVCCHARRWPSRYDGTLHAIDDRNLMRIRNVHENAWPVPLELEGFRMCRQLDLA